MREAVMPQRRLIVLLGSIVAIGPLSIDTYLPAFPAMSRSLDASASAVQLTLTACLAGIAIGQLVAGSLSDRLGRRRPIVAGLSAYIVVSLLCAVAPDVLTLTFLRFLQGFAAAAGLVVAQAVVASVVGLGVVLGLRETLEPERRDLRGLRQTLRTLRGLVCERDFMGYALASSLGFAVVFAYVSGSSFVLQDVYGVSPQLYSVIFGVNGIGLIAASQANARIVGRFEPDRLLRRALATGACASIALLGVVSAGGLGAWAVMVPLFVIVSSLAFVLPNATALALADHPHVAGAASALLGVIQFLAGALVAPLVGVAGTDTALPMGIVMSVLGVAAVATLRILVPMEAAS